MTLLAQAFIDEHGGSTAVARLIGREPGTVAVWRHRNSIPRSAWPDLIQHLPDCTMERLLRIEAKREQAAA